MPPEELRGWLKLIRCPGLGAAQLIGLVKQCGSASAASSASRSVWSAAGIARTVRDALDSLDTHQHESDAAWCEEPRRGLIPWNDARYPQRLREIASCPPALFYRGDPDLLLLPQIAVVGSRNATPQGLETAEGFAAELARRGLTITSGLALGVDGAAHRGALSVEGNTIAVCATGLDRVYPSRHKTLASEIDRRGLLISEFAPGTAPRPENFPRRNRLISGLALGVLVVEAASESGSLITARLAAEQGREVFAIPGSIHNVMARGCHRLIRQGAKLVETVDDILEEIGGQVGSWLRSIPVADEESKRAEGHRHQRILDALGDQPCAIDALVEALGLGVDQLSAALIELELEGRVAPAAGGRVMRLKGPAAPVADGGSKR
ncbi:DNA protecting protein DprA [Panacagrimonas perspica]|uniref:DNA protecting protein DprA n=1 Tax=Panacagrimonas perspica TaxID=381431 RepID=A0A4V3F588_9GAMM|nr:DNA-processing protein DprA [Panacagrimonas perspica]TDU28126.1 DNA protecting protein DprA [Panacagrimonas perspica]THD00626.1 DNA protecting protein DprA [Panacagrimonas perspica]